MAGLDLLVVDGNPRERREAHRRDFGMTPGEAYAEALRPLLPEGARVHICLPADADAELPRGTAIAAMDGVVLTGSSLHLWNREPAVERQVALAREVFRAGVPFFGSCWGLQVAAVAAGGEVRRNPKGRELAFARNIARTAEGAGHPLFSGRPAAWDAPAIHLDVVAVPPPDCAVLASNAMSAVQAAEIRCEGGLFWGVQYHPEFTLRELGAIVGRIAPLMREEGFVRAEDEALAYAADLAALDAAPDRADLAWRLSLGDEVLASQKRLTEIRNWIDRVLLPEAGRRGRG